MKHPSTFLLLSLILIFGLWSFLFPQGPIQAQEQTPTPTSTPTIPELEAAYDNNTSIVIGGVVIVAVILVGILIQPKNSSGG